MEKPETANSVPPPGSDEAVAKGCTCPRIDNYYGRGYRGRAGQYIIHGWCPVHAHDPATRTKDPSHDRD